MVPSKVSCAVNAKFYFSWFTESSISWGSRANQRENDLREKYNHKDTFKQIKVNDTAMLRVGIIKVSENFQRGEKEESWKQDKTENWQENSIVRTL